MPLKNLSSLAGTVEKLKKGKAADAAPTVRQIAKQVASLQDGFLLLADALMEETQAVQTELNQWQAQRESWSRSMDRMASEVGCRMNEVDRLRAEASSLLNAARSDAATVAQNELHSLNCRIDEMHKQTIDIRDDIQAKVREFSSSIKACEKMSSIQQEVWELQRWKDVNNPKVQAEMVVTTVEEVIRSHTAQLLEDVEPKKIWKEIQRIHQEGRDSAGDLSKEMNAIAHAFQETKSRHESAIKDSAETVKHLDERIAQIEEANPHTWLCTIQDEVDSINKRKGQYDQAIEEVFQTVLTEIGRLSKETRRMDYQFQNMGLGAEGSIDQAPHDRYPKCSTDAASLGDHDFKHPSGL